MDQELARLIISVLVIGGVGWTILCLAWLKREDLTTSKFLYRIGNHSPQLNSLLILLSYALACDAMPSVDRWIILVVIIGMYLMGHAQWPVDTSEVSNVK